jgi:hypothetical protein
MQIGFTLTDILFIKSNRNDNLFAHFVSVGFQIR